MKKKIVLSALLPIQFIVVKIFSRYPEKIEAYYSKGLYPVLSRAEQVLFGWLPFSLGDLLYLCFGLLIIRWLVKCIRTRFANPKKKILQVTSTVSVFYFLFHVLWGMNYYRLPLHQGLGIKSDYSSEELIRFTEKLIEKSNQTHLEITNDSTQKVVFSFSKKEINNLAVQGLKEKETEGLDVRTDLGSYKNSIYSFFLSYMGFGGYLNPLTNEIQLNYKIPSYRHPTIVTHEMGHQLGYAKENEANFIAILYTAQHSELYFRYAGLTYALQHALADLAQSDPEVFERLLAQVNYGIRKNYQEVNDFWEKHTNPFRPVFKIFYSNYLKVNNQPEGIKSYSYVVALLVNYYQEFDSF